MSVVSPLFENTNYIFETNKNKFSIGLYLTHYLERPVQLMPPIEIAQIQQQGIIVLKDDWHLESSISKQLLSDSKVAGIPQLIKKAIETSLNNNRYFYSPINSTEGDLAIFAIEVQEVCSDNDPRGVLFVITEDIEPPDDIEQVLRLFSKIISNLLSRQDECIYNQVENKNKEYEATLNKAPIQTPKEVLDLRSKNSANNTH